MQAPGKASRLMPCLFERFLGAEASAAEGRSDSQARAGTKNRTDSIDQDISQTDPPRERPDENIKFRTKKRPNAAPPVRPRVTICHPCSTSCGSSPEATRAPGSAVGSEGCFNLFYNLSRTTVNRCVTIVSTTYSVGRAVTDTSDLLLRRCCIA